MAVLSDLAESTRDVLGAGAVMWMAVLCQGLLLTLFAAFFVTVYKVIFVEHKPRRLLKLRDIRVESFSRFWLALSPPPVSAEQPSGQSDSELISLPSFLSAASGVVLDVGPGSGAFTPYFTPKNITAIYGAEPTTGLHKALRKATKVTGLEEKYHILNCGGQSKSLLPALEKTGLLVEDKVEGVFDTIVCLRVLCSVPDPDVTLTTLYSLLRPGGRFIIFEHVVNEWRTPKGRVVARAMQQIFGILGWSFFMGDCRLTQDTVGILKKVGDADGGWETVELERTMESSILSWVVGQFVKRR